MRDRCRATDNERRSTVPEVRAGKYRMFHVKRCGPRTISGTCAEIHPLALSSVCRAAPKSSRLSNIESPSTLLTVPKHGNPLKSPPQLCVLSRFDISSRRPSRDTATTRSTPGVEQTQRLERQTIPTFHDIRCVSGTSPSSAIDVGTPRSSRFHVKRGRPHGPARPSTSHNFRDFSRTTHAFKRVTDTSSRTEEPYSIRTYCNQTRRQLRSCLTANLTGHESGRGPREETPINAPLRRTGDCKDIAHPR